MWEGGVQCDSILYKASTAEKQDGKQKVTNMAPQAVVVMAPEKPRLNDNTVSVFLAGITTSTNEADWRQTLTNALPRVGR